jgi:hypothetical protein
MRKAEEQRVQREAQKLQALAEEEEQRRQRHQVQVEPPAADKQHAAASPEPDIVALFKLILEKKNISMETWLQDHPGIARSTFMDWKRAASGKPVKRKVSDAKTRKFEEAIRRDALSLRESSVHDNVHDA